MEYYQFSYTDPYFAVNYTPCQRNCKYAYEYICRRFKKKTHCADCSSQLLNSISGVHCYFPMHNMHSFPIRRHRLQKRLHFDVLVLCWASRAIFDCRTSFWPLLLMSYPFLNNFQLSLSSLLIKILQKKNCLFTWKFVCFFLWYMRIH